MLNLNNILIFSENPGKLTEFYKNILQKDPEWNEGDFMGFSAGNTMIAIGPHDKVKGKNKNPERILINFETSDVKNEFKRIKDMGTKVIKELYQPSEEPNMWIATFEDPDGNFIQIASPFKE
jgi:predicted enzyme related to lactoylglutathione lyase